MGWFNGASGLLRRVVYMASRKTHIREENPYPTIVPPLVILSELLQPVAILEFGSGTVSTALFLNTDIFPHVERLVTCENDSAWIDRISEALTDPRAEIVGQQRPMAEIATSLDIAPFDLILIDDSFTWTERAQTIQAVMERRSKQSTVVIHDYDVPLYRDVARKGAAHEVIFSAFSPHTGMLWDTARLSKKQLKSLDHLLYRQRRKVELIDATTVQNVIRCD